MITLTVSEILRLHQKLLDATGGLSGTRDLDCWNLRYTVPTKYLAKKKPIPLLNNAPQDWPMPLRRTIHLWMETSVSVCW